MKKILICLAALPCLAAAPASAERFYSGGAVFGASANAGKMAVSLQCDGNGAQRFACSEMSPLMASASMETPASGVFCGGGKGPRQIEYLILDRSDGEWDAVVTVDGNQVRAMTAYSYFGKSMPPDGFVMALLGEDDSEVLVFKTGGSDWLEVGGNRYDPCQ